MNHQTTDCVAIFSFPYGSFEHEACSHPLGSASWPAVDESLQVVDLPGVYVVGPGSFPRMGARQSRADAAVTVAVASRRADESLVRESILTQHIRRAARQRAEDG